MRSKNIIQKPLTLKDSYKEFNSDIKSGGKYDVGYKLYREICEDANKLISKYIIEDGESFKAPYRLGDIRIKKRKVDLKRLRPNFGLYNDSEGDIKNKHLNEHSDFYYVRFYWNKSIATIVKNKTAYCFIPTRYNKRYLARVIKEAEGDQIIKYFE